ncbi:MAG: class I SAM-dependent methyltransferase [Bacteroidota bacterium]
MENAWLKRWNDRYSEASYAYGEAPNEYLKNQLSQLPPGSILFGAEGEGRNAVFAAKSGWNVSAFDISIEGKNKAEQLAERHGVSLDYRVGELPKLDFHPEQFDAIALIYAHFPSPIISTYHQLLDTFLRPGGMIIFEAFGKNHLHYRQRNEKVGGPPNLEALFSTDQLKADFQQYEAIELVETEVELHEGLYHNGLGSVVRFLGKKLG